MSADNGVYIRQLKDGRFSVAHIASLYPEDMTDEELDAEFSEGNVVFKNTYCEAVTVAEDIAETCYVLEHGICEVPRKDGFLPPERIATYAVTIQKVVTETYTYSDVTYSQAQEMALKAGRATAEPGVETHVFTIKTVND